MEWKKWAKYIVLVLIWNAIFIILALSTELLLFEIIGFLSFLVSVAILPIYWIYLLIRFLYRTYSKTYQRNKQKREKIMQGNPLLEIKFKDLNDTKGLGNKLGIFWDVILKIIGVAAIILGVYIYFWASNFTLLNETLSKSSIISLKIFVPVLLFIGGLYQLFLKNLFLKKMSKKINDNKIAFYDKGLIYSGFFLMPLNGGVYIPHYKNIMYEEIKEVLYKDSSLSIIPRASYIPNISKEEFNLIKKVLDKKQIKVKIS